MQISILFYYIVIVIINTKGVLIMNLYEEVLYELYLDCLIKSV